MKCNYRIGILAYICINGHIAWRVLHAYKSRSKTTKTRSIANTIYYQRRWSAPWLESVLQVRSWKGTFNGLDSLLGTISASDMLMNMALGRSYGCWRTSGAIIGVLELLLCDLGPLLGPSCLVLGRSKGRTWVFLGRSPSFTSMPV